jgi:ADP-dependent NAD(P)H-hydrate dehydratase / NAD(P)H-hydrate epimerase
MKRHVTSDKCAICAKYAKCDTYEYIKSAYEAPIAIGSESRVMIKVKTTQEIRTIEAEADAWGLSYAYMMDRAGRAVAQKVMDRLRPLQQPKVTVLVGPGNNGGDGLVAATYIAQWSGSSVRAYLVKERDPATDQVYKAAQESGVSVTLADHDQHHSVLRTLISTADVVLDALFGIGVRLPLRPDSASLLQAVHQALIALQVSDGSTETITTPVELRSNPLRRPWIIAIDCPSGLDCDTGALDQNTIPADETVTFIAAKPGLLTFPGAQAVGTLHIASLGLPKNLPALSSGKVFLVDSTDVSERIPERPLNANKGTFGKVMIVGGSRQYTGAVALASQAAYRVGCGLVTAAAPRSVVESLRGTLFEPTWLPLPEDDGALNQPAVAILDNALPAYDVTLLGPGMGRSPSTASVVIDLLHTMTEHTPSIPKNMPRLVLDADALNILSEHPDWWQRIPPFTILTPHPGEMARLVRSTTEHVAAERGSLVREKAAAWNAVVVLKGAHTLIGEPGGQVAVIPFKTDALAKAGTGDVLAGMIAGFLAQGLEPFQAAVVGAFIHAAAGVHAAEVVGSGRSVLAGDVISAIGPVLSRW